MTPGKKWNFYMNPGSDFLYIKNKMTLYSVFCKLALSGTVGYLAAGSL